MWKKFLVVVIFMFISPVIGGEVRVVDVGRVASKVICQGTTLKLKCENSSLAMVIYAASYGREEPLCPFREGLVDKSVIQANDTDDKSVCPMMNVTTQIMKLCDKKRRCIVSVNETYFGSHCKGIYKYLKVIYACVNKRELNIRTIATERDNETKTSTTSTGVQSTIQVNQPTTQQEVRIVDVGRVASKVICQGTTLKFKCGNSSLAMVIYAASYGREEDGDTLCPFREGLVDKSVIQANDTDDESVCPMMNVTTQIMKLCDKKRRCIVSVNETYFGSHCKGIYKYLKVIYAYGVQSTIQVNGTNYTTTNETVSTTTTTVRPVILTTQKRPSSKAVSSDAPVIMGQSSPEVVMVVAGSLYLWFLHMKET